MLKTPEVGWERIDDTSNIFSYDSGWSYGVAPSYYNGGRYASSTANSTVAFNFTGTGIRIISAYLPNGANFSVTVDGVVYNRTTLKTTSLSHIVAFELTGLVNKEHKVILKHTHADTNKWLLLDAVDIKKIPTCLLQTTDSLYTIAPDGTLKNLGSIATADKMALFASDGFETLTKANCETIASQLGKCKILRAKI